MDEFFDIGKAFAMQPPALGRNIGILTDAGGPGVMTVDECEFLGLTVEQVSMMRYFRNSSSSKTQNVILKIAATSNPVDLTGSVTDDMFVISAELMFQDPKSTA